MMLDYIDRHSDDPDLGAAALAVKFRCSERYVHRLFSATDRSVGEHVNDKRILACTRKFLDHGCRNKQLRKSLSPQGFETFRISTDCSSAAMARHLGSFVVP